MMKSQPKPPSYESLLTAIERATSPDDLAMRLDAARMFFMGTQREALEEAVRRRNSQLPDGDALAT